MNTGQRALKFKAGSSSRLDAGEVYRNLSKCHLGSVIFGCTNSTIKECLSNQLFGLPSQHFSYVKNIDPGLPLFLFNYSERKLNGIFEAASSGQININPYGWTTDGSERTLYPAQVQILVRKLCQPLLENQFKPIIKDNYYSPNHFWFELDHAQTNKLISLLSSQAMTLHVPQFTTNCKPCCTVLLSLESRDEGEKIKSQIMEEHFDLESQVVDAVDVTSSLDAGNSALGAHCYANESDEEVKCRILHKLQQFAIKHHESPMLPLTSDMNHTTINKGNNLVNNGSSGEPIKSKESDEEDFGTLTGLQSPIAKLVQELQELKESNAEQARRIVFLEEKLLAAEGEIQELKGRITSNNLPNSNAVEAKRVVVEEQLEDLCLDPDESIFLIGGYDGASHLSTLELYDPSSDMIKSLRPMSSVRAYASVAWLNSQLYVFGGGNGCAWYNTVESYNLETDQWTLCPSLNLAKGSLGGVSIGNKLFAIGGGNGIESFSDVEMLDMDLGRWICTRSMLQRRFAVAAVELNGVLYATGGFDGNDYMRSAERFDIREHSWTQIPNMNAKRGCHSLVTLNEKLYAVGGFDGDSMVSSVEVYDPRMESWIVGEPMNKTRGYAAAGVINESIYIIGGVLIDDKILNTVESYKEGCGWQEKTSRVLRKRCFQSAIVR
ncbi:Kelch-like protein 8 [Cucurbita argyrosperma subsp. argyrosperma]|nr:Kelch-like protein 8 [Cucurbita argyrosperma subsp. argyrosperma]